MAGVLYVLRFKVAMKGIHTEFVEVAPGPNEKARAEAVGRAWCNQEAGRKFIALWKAIVADERILDPDYDAEEPEAKPAKPKEPKEPKGKAA